MDKPVRIVRIITRLNVGGPAWEVSVLERSLVEPEFSSVLVCGDVGSGEIESPIFRTWTTGLVRVPGLGRQVHALSDVTTFVRLVILLRRHRPAIVHTHTAKAGVLGRLAAIVARVPIRVHTFHGHLLHGYFSPRVTRLVIRTERILARHTTALVSVGRRVRDELVAAGIAPRKKFVVIPPGVEARPAVDPATARNQLGFDEMEKVVLFVGRLTAVKRPDRLIEAFREVVARVPSARLLIVGGGELSESSRQAACDLGGRVRFEGWRDELETYYAASDVVVLTSDNEGMPVSLIEASMAGRPCVTTDVGSAAEVVIDGVTGLAVPPDAALVADSLITLLMDASLREKMSRAASAHALASFGSQRLAEDHRRLYRELMHRVGLESGM